jgi:hypothetical protein
MPLTCAHRFNKLNATLAGSCIPHHLQNGHFP